MSTVAADSLVGSTLGEKYAIEAFIGEGAMGSVYRAHQTSLRKTVAIKVLHRHLAEQPTFVERFQREAYSASLLDHPNSLRVLDFGQSDGLLYLVMEFVQGEDLLTVMERDWPFSNQRIVDIMCQALAALATAHDLGIVHRDLKPENILLLRGTDDEGKPIDLVKVCDFGIAKLMGAPLEKSQSFSRHLTKEGFVIGTPDYMSPEQARGEEIDGRSDLYSIGVVLYQLLVGQLPFTAETPLGVVLRHISDPPPPPSSHGKVHARLEAICIRALAKDPRNRFENAREMRRSLRVALLGDDAPPISVVPAPAVHSTDMTSVPVSRPTPQVQGGFHLRRMVRGLRAPVTAGGRAAALVATTVSVGGFVLLMQYLSTPAVVGSAGAMTNSNTVLTNPSPPVTDSTLAPNTGAPAAAAVEPAEAMARRSDRAQTGSDRHRIEKSAAHTSAIGSPGGPAPIGTGSHDNKAVPSPVSSPRGILGQPPSPASADTVAGSVPSAAGSPSPAAPEPATRAAPPPAHTANAAPPAAEPVAPSAPSLLDPSRASVAIGAITTTGGISASKVRVALARVPFTPCYRNALAKRSSAAPMEASLRIAIDMSGHVTGAALSSDGNLPGLRPCIESEARGLTIRDVDTGDGLAVVTLTFSPQ